MVATNQQVQNYVDQRVRPRSEQIRNLYLACKDDKATLDDVYAALTQPSPTWTDSRSDSPSHLLGGDDVLAWNAFLTGLISFVEGNANYAKIVQACIRGI